MHRDPRLTENAKSLRRELTPAEKKIWAQVRGRRLGGWKFYRQYQVPPYVVDFCCPLLKLVLEIDGETHLGKEANDEHRTKFLESQGFMVLRFWNTEVFDELESVLQKIWNTCRDRQQGDSAPQPE